jgi:nucleoside-diphosphate-sugar epimerase
MKKRDTVLLTGSSGFIGQRYLSYNRKSYTIQTVSLQQTSIEAIDFANIKVIIHLAGIAHRMDQPSGQIYYDVNVEQTRQLAIKAQKGGVPHFIFASSVKVYGDELNNTQLDETSPTAPEDDYGKSKLQAEQILRGLENEHFKVAIVRPPLVYGAGVKGNMLKIMALATKPYPLPLKGINNQRSMVFIDNLVALFNTITENQASGVFIAGDKKPLSTSQLFETISTTMGKKPHWFKVPHWGISLLKSIKPALVSRLFGSFVIDNTQTNKTLNFIPPHTAEEGIAQMVNWYKTSPK